MVGISHCDHVRDEEEPVIDNLLWDKICRAWMVVAESVGELEKKEEKKSNEKGCKKKKPILFSARMRTLPFWRTRFSSS